MNKDKQIAEMVMVLTESQHAFDRAWKSKIDQIAKEMLEGRNERDFV